MPAQTTTETQDGIPVKLLNAAIGALKPHLAALMLVSRDFSSEVAEQGDTVRINVRGGVTVRTKVEGTDITSDAPTNTKKDVVLEFHKYVSWASSSMVTSLTLPEAINYLPDAMAGLAEEIEGAILAAMWAQAGNAVGTAEVDLDASGIKALMRKADELKFPVSGRHLIVSAKDKGSLLEEPQVTHQNIRGEQATAALTDGLVGRIFGFDVFYSGGVDSVSVTAGTPPVTTVTTHNVAFHPSSVAFVSRALALPPEGTANAALMVDPETGLVLRYVQAYDAKAMNVLNTIDILFGVRVVDPRLCIDAVA
jgi:hypothetical protein